MSTSSQMQAKIGKINKLIAEGYSLTKSRYGFVDLKNSSGRSISIYGILSSPAGFSWIAFLFPFAVCSQIKEWSYFYYIGVVSAIASLVQGITGFEASNAVGIAIGVQYAYMFPYLRKIASDSRVVDNPVGKSIVYGVVFSLIAVIPAIIIDVVFAAY
ncbi:hypothetical protein OAL60_00735 [bacterium]|nr:hypothetical protein [bacterium]